MKKIAVFLALVCLLGSTVFAQSARTRARVVTTPTPAPVTDDSAPATTGKRPPVLQGAQRPSATPTPAEEQPVADDDEVIRVETNLVTMPVSVLDRDGRFISGLTQRDFQIFENGVQQKIEHFQSVEQPFTVLLLIDVTGADKPVLYEDDAPVLVVEAIAPDVADDRAFYLVGRAAIAFSVVPAGLLTTAELVSLFLRLVVDLHELDPKITLGSPFEFARTVGCRHEPCISVLGLDDDRLIPRTGRGELDVE